MLFEDLKVGTLPLLSFRSMIEYRLNELFAYGGQHKDPVLHFEAFEPEVIEAYHSVCSGFYFQSLG